MITIAKRVEVIIRQWPLIKQGLDLGLMNLSSLARYLRPQLESETGERISEAAVLMALRRYQAKALPHGTTQPQGFLGDLSVRSGLSDLTYTNTPTLNRRALALIEHANPQRYLTISRGLLQTSIIAHEEISESIVRHLRHEHLETRVDGLTAITLHLKPGHEEATGVLAQPLGLLAWRGIKIVEVVSTFDELSIVIYDEDVEEAFRELKQLERPR